MLHNNFIVCIMTCSIFALLLMIAKDDFEYIILPIGILIWGIFKFFDEDDRKYLEERGIDPDEFNAFFPNEYDNTYNNHHRTYSPRNNYVGNSNTITWNSPSDVRREQNDGFFKSRGYQNPVYKELVKKCKRNFKITVDKLEKNESKKGFIRRIASIE